ncbi:MAG: hypothetical protein E6K32_19980 [Gammaproteobacteria bacterium]|nr:MAG: hypothetical protein E6K32_19980 [Gammaproteobacteria bacterium]
MGHLLHEQGDQLGRRQLDQQLVDRKPAPALEDLDADDVAPDGADAAGHRAQGAGAVGHPDPGDVGEHDRTLRPVCERPVSRPRNDGYL